MNNRQSPIFDPSFQRAKAAFDLRYYRWAQQQAQTESAQDFPLLRSIKNALVYRFLEVAGPMGSKGQDEFLKALVKRAHGDAVKLLGEAITSREEELIDRYLNFDRLEMAPGLQALDATFERHGDERIYRSVKERAVLPKIDKKQLRSQVVEKLGPILGDCSINESPDSWWYETKIGPWSVWTLVNACKKFVHLSYFQRITVQDGIDLRFPLSVMQWFGIGGGTDWTLWDDSEIQDATDSLARLVKHFLDAAPDLLEGIPPVTFGP